MSTPAEVRALLNEARALGIAFSAREGRLFHVPRSIPREFAERVRPHKEALIRALSGGDADPGLPPLVAAAQSAFAGLGGLTLARVGTREDIGFPEPDPVPALNERACRCCYRVCWWSLDPKAALFTCGYCHPPAAHLKVTWHTDDRGGGA